jgi:UDP-glucose 4-epimerase
LFRGARGAAGGGVTLSGALLRDARIAVTGAGGFIGSAVVDACARHGAQVIAIVGAPGEAVRTPQGASGIARADIRDADALRGLIHGCEAVVHLAGPASVAASFDDPSGYVQLHTEGTAALLSACRAARVSRVVYVSSAEVYGQPLQSPVPENHRLSARSPYGAAKIGAEKVLEAYVNAFGIRGVVLRPFSIYGPAAAPQSLIPRILQLARERDSVELRDLRPVRDYCFVADLAEAAARACAFRGAEWEVFNIGTMRGTSVEGVARLVLEAMGKNCEVRQCAERERPGQSEIYHLVADNRRALEWLGWRPIVSLEEGLRLTIAGSFR